MPWDLAGLVARCGLVREDRTVEIEHCSVPGLRPEMFFQREYVDWQSFSRLSVFRSI